MRVAGIILDMYDRDPGNKELIKVASVNSREIFEETIFTPEEMEKISDAQFALVTIDNKGDKFRKYLSNTPGHTKLSAAFFLQNHSKLPEGIQKETANRFIEIAKRHKIELPGAITKIAQGEKVASISTHSMHSIKFTNKDGPEVEIGINSAIELEKVASSYVSNIINLTPYNRRKVAIELTKIAKILKVNLGRPMIKKYASAKFCPSWKGYATLRKDYLKEEEPIKLLEEFIEKAASLKPHKAAEVLEVFDKKYGLDRFYGTLPDAYFSMIGDHTKQAGYKYGEMDESTIKKLAERKDLLKGHFPAEIIEKFANAPISTFRLLPSPHKNILVGLSQKL